MTPFGLGLCVPFNFAGAAGGVGLFGLGLVGANPLISAGRLI